MTTDEIRAELEDLRIAGNSPKVGLYAMRRIYRRRAELFALLEDLETQLTKGTNDGRITSRPDR